MTEARPANARAGAAVAAAALLVLFATATARQHVAGGRALAASDEAMAQGETARAIDQARIAAQARALGSPHPERAYARLEAIARAAEKEGDRATAERAFRAVRAGAASTRVFGRAEDEARLARADAELARLATSAGDGAPEARGEAPRSPEPDGRADPRAYVALGVGGALLAAGLTALVSRRTPRFVAIAMTLAGLSAAALASFLA